MNDKICKCFYYGYFSCQTQSNPKIMSEMFVLNQFWHPPIKGNHQLNDIVSILLYDTADEQKLSLCQKALLRGGC